MVIFIVTNIIVKVIFIIIELSIQPQPVSLKALKSPHDHECAQMA